MLDASKLKSIANKVLIIIGILLILLLAAWLSVWNINRLETKGAIDISALDMRGAHLPTQWTCSWCESPEVVDLDWIYKVADPVSMTFMDDSEEYPLNEILWIDERTASVVRLVIVDYGSAVNARWIFWAINPSKIYRRTYWNFGYSPENIVPRDWDYRNTEADEERVQCASGTQGRCSAWYYDARYGQYYTVIESIPASDVTVFERIVNAVNQEFLRQLNDGS